MSPARGGVLMIRGGQGSSRAGRPATLEFREHAARCGAARISLVAWPACMQDFTVLRG